MSKLIEHISFSALKEWNKCPYYFNIVRIQKRVEPSSSIFTEFGQACHDTLEDSLLNKISKEDEVMKEHFLSSFDKYLENLKEKPKQEDIDQFRLQGLKIIPQVLPEMEKVFGKYEVVDAEMYLYEDIEDYKSSEQNVFKFKGYIDLVIKTEDGKYHIIDWKTSSWGWDAKKKSDPMVTYQLTYYKNFFSKKFNVDPKNIETYFVLLKRIAKKNHVEIIRVTSGPKKTKNALKLLETCLYNVEKERWIKKRTSCDKCDLKGTELCP